MTTNENLDRFLEAMMTLSAPDYDGHSWGYAGGKRCLVGEAYRKIPQYYRDAYGGVVTTVGLYYNVPYSLIDTIVYEIEIHPMYQNDLEEAKDRVRQLVEEAKS